MSTSFQTGLAVRMGIFAWGMLLTACHCAEENEFPARAGQLARAAEMLRLSSNHDKPRWLLRLRSLPCGSNDLCELQITCSGAYNEYLHAIDSIDSARRDLMPPLNDATVPDASAEAVLNAAALAQNAQRLLKKSRQAMNKCAENEAVIRQRYKLR